MPETQSSEDMIRTARDTMEAGDFTQAAELYHAVIGTAAAEPGAFTETQLGNAKFHRAVCLRDSGQLDLARQAFRDIDDANRASDNAEMRYGAGLSGYLRAEMMLEAGEKIAAADLFGDVANRMMIEDSFEAQSVFHNAMRRVRELEGEAAAPAPVAAPPQEDEVFTYSKRQSAVEKTERVWRFEDERIVCERPQGSHAIPYADITNLHLSFAPTRVARGRYIARISTQSGRVEEFDNMSWRGIADFEARDMHYALAVKYLAARLDTMGSRATVTGGSSWGGYIGSILSTVFLALVLVLVLLSAAPWLVLVKAALILFYTPTLIRWLKANKPKTGTLTALPDDCLP